MCICIYVERDTYSRYIHAYRVTYSDAYMIMYAYIYIYTHAYMGSIHVCLYKTHMSYVQLCIYSYVYIKHSNCHTYVLDSSCFLIHMYIQSYVNIQSSPGYICICMSIFAASNIFTLIHLIGLREKNQENPLFHWKIHGFRFRFSLSRQPID